MASWLHSRLEFHTIEWYGKPGDEGPVSWLDPICPLCTKALCFHVVVPQVTEKLLEMQISQVSCQGIRTLMAEVEITIFSGLPGTATQVGHNCQHHA